MRSTPQSSIDYLRAIETLSEDEQKLEKTVDKAGPGGEAYDRAPNPAPPEQKSKIVKLGERAKQIFQNAAEQLPQPKNVAQKTSEEAGRIGRRAAAFFKYNGALIAGIGLGGVAIWAGREYWKRHQSR